MKSHWNSIKVIVVLLIVAALYSFTNIRNGKRVLLTNAAIEFIDDDGIFISRDAVNKLLIQSNEGITSMIKEKLVLSKLESALNANAMIRSAHVYVTIDGQLNVKIKQKTPIARVNGVHPFYIDDEGGEMPLSEITSARVPLITGMTNKEKVTDIYRLATHIYKDEFLRKNVIGIHQEREKFILHFRVEDFVIQLGDIQHLNAKFSNLKAFYQKASKDNTLRDYRIVNLEFNHQIVCTKK